MFFIESERLRLIPLTHEQLLLLKHDRKDLELSIGLHPSAMVIDAHFQRESNEALLNFWLPYTKDYPDLYHWYTNWQIILKSINTTIGGISLGGYPNDYGETNIGYLIDEKHQGNGYATEALHTLSTWGFQFSILKYIHADTLVTNHASQQVLLKAGFNYTHSVSTTLYYRLPKPL
jgi:ribosomal-protein-alanine N-acetyltransferase